MSIIFESNFESNFRMWMWQIALIYIEGESMLFVLDVKRISMVQRETERGKRRNGGGKGRGRRDEGGAEKYRFETICACYIRRTSKRYPGTLFICVVNFCVYHPRNSTSSDKPLCHTRSVAVYGDEWRIAYVSINFARRATHEPPPATPGNPLKTNHSNQRNAISAVIHLCKICEIAPRY